jgi:hypothetical protein
MTRASIAGGAFVTALAAVMIAVIVRYAAQEEDVAPATSRPETTSSAAPSAAPDAASSRGFLHGRITTIDGATYEGRLRWGRDQEAFWDDYFNGVKDGNPWAMHAPPALRPKERRTIEIFGIELGGGDRSDTFDRTFMARFGDIARIEAHVGDVQVTLKSGTRVTLDRFSAGDIDDGVRVWDGRHGVVDLDARRIRTIEFLPTPPLVGMPARLHGTVRTRRGDFSGFVLWGMQDRVGSDELEGRAAGVDVSLRYDAIGSIARHSHNSARATLRDGREMVLTGTREAGDGHHGIYVDDPRYGRVMITWDAFERVDFNAGGSGPGYAAFTPGHALAGSVTTRDGRRLAGRLVYDFDESETTETLDATLPGLDYAIPFSLVTSIAPRGRERHATVILRDGAELHLERTGDLGERHAGMLIFVDGNARAEHVPWPDVDRVDFVPEATK